MLDLTGIMFSSIMMLIIIVRAATADRSEPWFQTIERKVKPVVTTNKPLWQRGR